MTVMAQVGHPQLDSLMKEKDTVLVKTKIENLMHGNEMEMTVAVQYLASKDEKRIPVLLNLLLERFPNGYYAENLEQNNILSEKDSLRQEQMLETYKKRFPGEGYSSLNGIIAYSLAERKQIIAIKYAERVQGAYRPVSSIRVANKIIEFNPQAGIAFLEKEMKHFKKDIGKVKISGSSPKPESSGYAYSLLANSYAQIISEKGRKKEALQYFSEAYGYAGAQIVELAHNYAFALVESGLYPDALVILEKILKAGNGNSEVREQFKRVYRKVNKEQDPVLYLENIDKRLRDDLLGEVSKNAVNISAPDFVVQDESGRTVSLRDFRGKTLILDFWATWCAPCKKSFPAMQRVVNKYKNDTTVKFLFIHTWERTKTPLADAKAYLSGSNYNFDLYMDTLSSSTNKNQAVTAFGVKGIPAKFVIDTQGNIRFKIDGFSDGDDKAVEDLSVMIDYAKDANQNRPSGDTDNSH